jgi:peptidoglycan/LPS O-acetylase OafA/YrhL
MRIGVVATERRTLELIQIFRGAAALAVMLYHMSMTNHFYSPYLANAFGWGHAGIDFFFQLSGFIMLYVHWEQAGQVRRAWRFVVLRAIRIYPIYWCVLAVTIVMFWLHPPPPENMWAPLTTLQPRTILNSALLRDPSHTIIAPAWTLTYEVMFYLFFALYFVVGRWVFALLSLAWVGAIVAQWQGIAYWPHPVLLRLIVGEFFLGMAAAVIVKCWAPRRVSGWWVVLALAVWLVFARAEMIGAIEPYTWWAIPGFVLLLAGGLYDQATTRTYDRALVLVGEASYVIYLIHYGMIALFARTVDAYRPLASRQPEVTLTLLALAIVLAGVAIHLVIERPLLRMARRYLWGEDAPWVAPRAG